MKVLYVGEEDFVGAEMRKAFVEAGHDLTSSADGAGRPAPVCDVLVAFEPSPAVIKELVARFRGKAGHLVHISSHRVYPAVPRDRPWTPPDFDALADTLDSDIAAAGFAAEVAAFRAAEREMRLAVRGRMPWTVLRPAMIEGPNDPYAHSAWFVNRIVDGGPVVLPDDKTLIYRHVAAADLARAAVAVAGQKTAFERTLNVVSRGILSYWGHAAMLRDGLRRSVGFRYVPAARWQAAGLPLPVGAQAWSSFIEASPLLTKLRWEPLDDVAFLAHLARHLEALPRPYDRAERERERALLAELEPAGETAFRPGRAANGAARPKHWQLCGWPGQPNSLSLRAAPEPAARPPVPLVKTLQIAVGAVENRVLRGEFDTAAAPLVLGHNALVEVVQSGGAGPRVGQLAIPLAQLPCGDDGCAECAGTPLPRNPGIDCDGYAFSVHPVAAEHLVRVPADLRRAALLAHPLAALLDVLAGPLANGSGQVWVYGVGAEATLLCWLAEEFNRSVVRAERTANRHNRFATEAHDALVRMVAAGTLAKPEIVADFGEMADEVAAAFNDVLAADGLYCGWRRPETLDEAFAFRALPAGARTRKLLDEALALLRKWSQWRDVAVLSGPGVPLEAAWDGFAASSFSQAFVTVEA